MARVKVAMSLAVDICPLWGSPDALRNVVRDMPILRALWVIFNANLRSVPLMDSAITDATSLADLIIMAITASLTKIDWPAFRPSREAGRLAAFRETIRRVEKLSCFFSTASNNR